MTARKRKAAPKKRTASGPKSKKKAARSREGAARKLPPATTAMDEDFPPTLDDVIVSLQKAFSRVSTRSQQVPDDQARALITGRVEFELDLRGELDEADDFVQVADGSIGLTLKGALDPDVREVESAESETRSNGGSKKWPSKE